MGLHEQCVLVLTALCTVILVTLPSRVGANIETEENITLPPIPNVIRQITFQGKSHRPLPPFPSTVKGHNGRCDCQYHVTCAYQLDKIKQTCKLPGGETGVCCPPVGGGRTGIKSVLPQYHPQQTLKDVSEDIINSACTRGKEYIHQFNVTESKLFRDNITLEPGSPASNHLRVFTTTPETQERQRKALELCAASKYIASELDQNLPSNVDAENSPMGSNCLKMPNCPNPKCRYRTASGECNNLNNPEWGMSETELWRLLPPKYEDGICSPRVKGKQGGQLPLVRTVANKVLPDMDDPDLRYTLSVMQWAQFMDHDLSHTPFPEMKEPEVNETGEGKANKTGYGKAIRCCTEDCKMFPPDADIHPLCMPIEIPRNDSFFAQRNHTCMNFVRSNIVCPFETKCRFRHAEQINTVTQWIDGSTVYGQNQNEQKNLRDNHSGLLRNSTNNFLPIGREDGCDRDRGVCYLAGDSRVNEQPGLTMMHTLWMRQHNRIAGQLKQINSHWSDETLFQETRRIIVAQITHITYNEWLPIIIGETFMEKYGLLPQRNGFSSDYDPSINANTNNEFATATFRFGHSLVQGLINLFIAQGNALNVTKERLRDNFMTGQLITLNGSFDGVLRGLTRQRPQRMDNFVTVDLKNHLLQTPNYTFGMDLMSLNIQRGRDHAIGTYNEARGLCGLGKAKTFKDLTDTISLDIVEELEELYDDVDDIDLFVGGMAETSYWYQGGDGILGPTFLCIVGDQFTRLKRADRYYYELKGQAGQFTLEQLQEIRRTSWARIVCDNSENLDEIQPLAFRYPHHFNRLVPCTSQVIPQINLQPWYDDDGDDQCDDGDDDDDDDDDDDHAFKKVKCAC